MYVLILQNHTAISLQTKPSGVQIKLIMFCFQLLRTSRPYMPQFNVGIITDIITVPSWQQNGTWPCSYCGENWQKVHLTSSTVTQFLLVLSSLPSSDSLLLLLSEWFRGCRIYPVGALGCSLLFGIRAVAVFVFSGGETKCSRRTCRSFQLLTWVYLIIQRRSGSVRALWYVAVWALQHCNGRCYRTSTISSAFCSLASLYFSGSWTFSSYSTAGICSVNFFAMKRQRRLYVTYKVTDIIHGIILCEWTEIICVHHWEK